MIINHNIPALNAHRLLNANTRNSTTALERLSSGKRINKSGDDAAGMAISEKMRAQVRGLTMASRNTMDGVSLVQTAEGAMAEIHSMLQRMRELSVQAANGTQTTKDREAIQDEINQLTSEINRVGNGTEYNTRNVLKGNEAPQSNTIVHSMSTGKPATITTKVDVNSLAAGSFDLADQKLSIWVNGKEKVVNLTVTNNKTSKDDFMNLLNDALGKDAKALVNDKGFIEIQTMTTGGNVDLKIDGSGKKILDIFGLEPATITGTAFAGNKDYTSVADIKLELNGTPITVSAADLVNLKALGDRVTVPAPPAPAPVAATVDEVIAALQKDLDSNDQLRGKVLVQNDAGKIKISTADEGANMSLKVVSGLDVIASIANASIDTGIGIATGTGVAENASGYSEGSFYFEKMPEVGSKLTIGNEVIEFFDSSKAPYVGTNRPVDLNSVGKDKPTPGLTDTQNLVQVITQKFATAIDGVILSQDSPDMKERITIKAIDKGFSGNLIYLEGTIDDFNANLQIGANNGQGFRLEVGDIRSKALKISGDNPTRNPGVAGASYTAISTVTDGVSSAKVEYAIDVTTEERASAAIEVFNNAIIQLSAERSKLGATQNRLEHTLNNLENTNENLTAALSRIEDADMAQEMAEFTRLNILQQSGTAMLQKANQFPQLVLQLLQG